MKTILAIILVGLPILTLQRCSILFEPDLAEFANPENEILNEMNVRQMPSLAAWVVKDEAIVWQRYFGYADVRGQLAADSTTIYGLASIAKLIVVTAVMQLNEQGMINLNTDINDYLPFAVRNPNHPNEKITPYHLMTHTSGLNWPEDDSEVPGYYNRYILDASPRLSEWLPDFILPEGTHYVPTVWMNHRPGEREWYSNIGACLAAYLVEVISNTDFNEYCKQHIFEPLDMPNTSYAYADLDKNNLATLYDSQQHAIAHYRFQGYPAGDLKSTISDFSHFIIAYMNGGRYKSTRILKENTVNEILRIQNPASGLCLTWNCTLGNWYGHSGGKPGVAAYVEFQSDHNVALMIVSNTRHHTVYPGNKTHALVRRIARTYY